MQSFIVRSSCLLKKIKIGAIPVRFSTSDSFTIQDPKDFDERVKNSKVPVIVDFFATWCAPCRALAPRLETVIAERSGLVKLAKVDIDENADLALNYKVGSIPVLVAIRNGKIEERLEGLQDADKIRQFVDRLLEQDKQKAKSEK